MTTTSIAGELLERCRAEIGKLELDLPDSWDDPMRVALTGSRDLLARALEASEGTSKRAASQAVVDTPWDPNIRRSFPTHEADSLMILAWAARCEIVTRSDARREPLPKTLVWANRTLRRLLQQGKSDALGENRHPDLELSSFLDRLAERSESGSAKASVETLKEFWAAICKAPSKVLDVPLEQLREEAAANRGTVTFHPDGEPKLASENLGEPDDVAIGEIVEIFRQSFFLRDNFHVVVGARVLHPGGVRLRLARNDDAPSAKYYDLYAVWNLQLPADESGWIPPEAFLSLQGLFIPVDLRHQLYRRFVEVHQRHQTAALVARNLSHNLGSHALLYLARDLRHQAPSRAPTPETEADGAVHGSEVATFLQYLVNRSDLVAMLASGPGHTFSVVLPLRAAVDQFNGQRLLHRYLCASETLRVSTVNLLGDARSIDLPGGLIGGQALCAVLENFSRNSAKHSRRLADSNRRIQLQLIANDAEGGLVKCCLSDENAAPISERAFEALRRKIDGVLAIPLGPLETRDPDLDVGLGMEEIATWLGYMRRLSDRGSWNRCDPPLMEYRQDKSTGRLSLIFYLLKASRIDHLTPGVHATRGRPLSSQLTIVPCADREQFGDTRRLPGRWLRVLSSPSQVSFQSRFEKFHSRDVAWSAVEESEPARSNLALAAYVETLRQFALGGYETLNVVIIDSQWYTGIHGARAIERRELPDGWIEEILSPHPRVRFFAADETAAPLSAAQPDDLAAALPKGAIAIWHRHKNWIPLLNKRGMLGDRVVHYEIYSGNWNYEYVTILSQQLMEDPEALLFLYGQLAEAALLRGVVVDERFARIHRNQELLRERLRWMGIEVIDPLPDGSESSESPSEGLPGMLRSISNREQTVGSGRLNTGFVSIHASLKRSPKLMQGRKWKDLLDIHAASIPLVALHSGRGGVDEGRELDYPFFPASLFQSWAFERPCKLFLSEALMRGGWI